ncbi:DUF2946 domain-containing protein [Stutzerimonas xanthomarina]|uniref:DUF2946 domain-containing protein n=2 Tax=Stutzerimonas xanthomarina TaxID=271420 RepID=A0A1M5PR62_9GAMM|nr:DUF2946 domain-containing protein [Stutzerimonas xanthomarina]MCP9338242.1 DUF2946 domain-containing protein [Stutzerimonas xanthomarina]SEH72381.1 Protein of unknown function [Stutzerimonas xanthomarina]SHH04029.1 Protein of unknown function [Stutzerimonas xanthomarina DSM 18231]
MRRPSRAPIWIAAFAVLLHLFAMPLMAAHTQGMDGTGGHCPMAEASQPHTGHVQHAHVDESTPKPSHHQGMPCCCAAGSASLAAITTGSPVLHQPHLVRVGSLRAATAPQLSPRYRWPALNPRASPLA